MKKVEIGHVSDFFAHIDVAAVEVTAEGVKIGDTLHFKGHTTDFKQEVKSLQIEHDQVEEAGVGSSVGIKVKDKARSGDTVFKLIDD
ncbi:MAG TPA: hypothetical protein VKO43_07665 [Candidatus Krumholzibacteriaceae bacterium]|nr:hypothetical protein [Candidatus Krumholzibacteriaceae bacterium]